MEFQELNKEHYEKLMHSLEVKYPGIYNRINEGINNTYNIIKSKSGS